MCDLEWGDQEKAADVFDENEEGSKSDIEVAEENISSGSLAEASSPSSNKGKNRRPPVWMRDYTTGEELSKEDNEAHLAMSTTTDHVNFQDALKSEKWWQAMDLEMEAMNRNDTW